MRYIVTIVKTMMQDFEVEANSKRDAGRIARRKYDNNEFALDPEENDDVSFTVNERDDEEDEDWL